MSIDTIYDENLVVIFNEFALRERISFREVCLRWNRIINDTTIWKDELRRYFETTKALYTSDISWAYAKTDIGDMRNSQEILRFVVERDLLARGLELGNSRTTVTSVTTEGADIETIDLFPGGEWLLTASEKCITVWKARELTPLATTQFENDSIVSDWAWNQLEGSLTVLIRPKQLPSDLPAIVRKIILFPHDEEKAFDFLRSIEGIDREGVGAVTLLNKDAVVILKINSEIRISCVRHSLTELRTDSVLLGHNLEIDFHDLASKTAFTDSGHIAHISNTACAFWSLDQYPGDGIVHATHLTWLNTRSIYISKLRNLSDVSRINCNVITIDGSHFQREIDVRMECGVWRYSYDDIKVIMDVSRPQGQRTVGKRVFSQRIRSEDPMKWDSILSIIPPEGDGKAAEKVKRWSRKLKVDYDVASGVFVVLSKRKFVKGSVLKSGFVM